MGTTFSDPDDDFIQFLHDEWAIRTDDPESEDGFGKFLKAFVDIAGEWETGDDDSPDDPLGIMGV
jgi:hypothetical protein